MMRPTVEQMRAAYERQGSYAQAAYHLQSQGFQCSRDTVRRYLQKAADAGFDGSVPEPAPPGHRVKSISTLYDADGTKRLLWVKTTREQDEREDLAAAIREEFAEYAGLSHLAPAPDYVDDLLATVYPIPDLHMGMYSWAEETGADFDLRIADRLLKGSISRLVASSPASKVGVVLNLGDFFHTDTAQNRTPAHGHALDVDTRSHKVKRVGVRAMILAVETAKQKHALVKVRCLPGNHDPETAQMLAIALSLFYENDPRVEVDLDPSLFWFWRWGKVLLGAHHGDRVNPKQFSTEMAVRRAVDWGRTVWRYGLLGHIHHGSKVPAEWGGVEVETLQTLAARDAHHAGGPYQANRAMVSITYHQEQGEVERHKVNVSMNGKLH